MDPFARKMIFGSLAFASAVLLMAGAMSVVYFHNHPPCSEQVFSEAASPDGQWKAVVMERRCGEESPFFFHVSLRPAAAPIRLGYFSGRAEEGEIFVVEEDTADAEPGLEWDSPGQLTIHCRRCRMARAQKREEHWGPIAVRYQLQP